MALVVLLRGVNVGGHRTFRPSVLAQQLTHLGAVNIGAAGTFVIRRSIGQAKLRAEFARRLPFETEIVICQSRDIVRLLARDVFRGAPRPGINRFVSVLARSPRSTPSIPLQIPATGKWMVRIVARENKFVAGEYRRQMSVIGHLGKLDQIFGVSLTTRGWNTFATIAKALASEGK